MQQKHQRISVPPAIFRFGAVVDKAVNEFSNDLRRHNTRTSFVEAYIETTEPNPTGSRPSDPPLMLPIEARNSNGGFLLAPL